MAKKTNETPQQQYNNEVIHAFNKIIQDAQQILRVFTSVKYRTVITVDHTDNEKYPNLLKECVSYFFNLTLSTNNKGYMVIWYTYDREAIIRFGGKIYNSILRSLFKHTMFTASKANIENCVRINITTKDINKFFYKRFVDGESDLVRITALDQLITSNKSA